MLRRLPDFVRVGLGAVLLLFGLDGFLQFLPHPELPSAAGAFLGALGATGYMMPLIKLTEMAAGALLVTNRYVPLALAVLAPVVVNIVAFHIALAPGGLPIALLLLAAELYLAWAYRDAFAAMLCKYAVPERPRGAVSAAPGHGRAW